MSCQHAGILNCGSHELLCSCHKGPKIMYPLAYPHVHICLAFAGVTCANVSSRKSENATGMNGLFKPHRLLV